MFQAIFPLSKYLKIKSVRIYDFAFALHSKVSVVILLTCTLLVSARQYFGQPIECMSSEKQLDFINLFCWTMGTYIVTYPDGGTNYKNSIAFGVGSEFAGSERVYLRYYQWVVMILLMQALVFIFPAFLWKNWEGGLMEQLCSGLERAPVIQEKECKERRSRLLKFFTSDYNIVHRGYAKKYLFCEIINFLICIFNLTMMNIFFNGFWSNYSQAISTIPAYNWEEWNEMSSRVFPKLAKCEFLKYGASGSSSRYDALCVLPLNILNEKIFAFLYIWFLLLALASALHLIFRIILACCSVIRIRFTQRGVGRKQRTQVRQLLETMSYGEWFLLTRVNANVSPVIFADLLKDLSEIIKYKQLESSA